MSRDSLPNLLALALLALAFTIPAALSGQSCGDNEPAFPVPECRDRRNGDEVACTDSEAVRLWPADFQPGRPGEQLPAERDSTQWRSFTIPGFNSGHELFHSLDVVGDHLYVVYNAGLQVWSIAGPGAENPQLLFFKDGWRGDFFQFPSSGENDFFIYDVDAIDPGLGQDVLIAVAGEDGVGTSIWEHTGADLVELYQDFGTGSRQIRVAGLGGRIYAFAAGGGIDGVYVYDMTQAANLASPCLDTAGTVCPGVFLGVLGSATNAAFLDVVVNGGKVFVAIGRDAGLPAEIWEVADPANPGGAVRRFSGLSGGVQGIALFPHGGQFYLAAAERRPGLVWEVHLYRASDCVTGSGLCSVQEMPWFYRPAQVGSDRFLTFSASNGTPYLYYGVQSNALSGTGIEGLFDLTNLGGSNQITEVTADGGTYTDGCSGNTVDYWGDYYARNGDGLRNVRPLVGKFAGDYFYRAAFGILDVHLHGEPPPQIPTITTTAADPAPHYMNQPIGFSAAAEYCAGPEVWIWDDDDTVAGAIDASGAAAAITFGLCAGSDCPQREVEVWALKDACASDAALVENRATVTVLEPRPQIRAIEVCPRTDPGCPQVPQPEFPLCTALRFTAEVDGQPVLDHLWEVKDGGGAVVASGTEAVLDWDTSGASASAIFTDGLESGDVSAWTVGAPESLGLPQPLAKAILAGDFEVDLTLTNVSGSDQGIQALTLTALGALGFGAPALTATDQGGGQFNFQAGSQNATEWRWEIEDPANGSAAGCQVYASCRIQDWGVAGAETGFRWEEPNVPGTYGVSVSIRNCVETGPLSESISVDVTEIAEPEPPAVTGFRVEDPRCNLALGFYVCPLGADVVFEVTATGFPETYELDWDDDGSFEEQSPAASAITHAYAAPTTVTPAVRAVRGGLVSDPIPLDHPIIVQ